MANALAGTLGRIVGSPVVRWTALLALCAPFFRAGLGKLMDFPGAIAEMQQFGVWPPVPFATLTTGIELGAPALILLGIYRLPAALTLFGFALIVTSITHRFWDMAPPDQVAAANGFFDHLSIAGGLLLVAWHEARQ